MSLLPVGVEGFGRTAGDQGLQILLQEDPQPVPLEVAIGLVEFPVPGIGGVGLEVIVQGQIREAHHQVRADGDGSLADHVPQVSDHAVVQAQVYIPALADILPVGRDDHRVAEEDPIPDLLGVVPAGQLKVVEHKPAALNEIGLKQGRHRPVQGDDQHQKQQHKPVPFQKFCNFHRRKNPLMAWTSCEPLMVKNMALTENRPMTTRQRKT